MRISDWSSDVCSSDLTGMTAEEILSQFYDRVVFALGDAGWTTRFDPERLRGVKLSGDLKDARTGEVVVKLGTKITPRILERMREQGIEEQLVDEEELYGQIGRAHV